MPGMNPKVRHQSITIENPSVIITTYEEDRLVSNHHRKGTVRTDWVLTSLTKAPGPDGSECEIQVPGDFFILQGRKFSEMENLKRLIVKIELVNRVKRRNVINTLFLGRVVARDFEKGDNGNLYSLRCLDAWWELQGNPIYIPDESSSKMTYGQIFQSMEDGFYQIVRFANGNPAVTTVAYAVNPMLTDANDNNISRIDEDLKAVNWRTSIPIDGQVNQVLSDLITGIGNRIPDIEYDDNEVIVKGREYGQEEIELVVAPAQGDGEAVNHRLVPDIRGLRGSDSWIGRFNRIIAWSGTPTIRIEPITLEKGWTSSEETYVLGGSTTQEIQERNNQPRYYHVGRRYVIPNNVSLTNPRARSLFEGFANDNVEIQLRMSNTTVIDGDAWKHTNNASKPVNERAKGVNDEGNIYHHVRQRQFLALWFDGSNLWEHFTDAQNTSRQGGTEETPSRGFSDVRIQANIEDGLLQIDQLEGDGKPRTTYITDAPYSKETLVQLIDHDGDGNPKDETESVTVRDQTPFFQSHVDKRLQETSKDDTSFSITLKGFDPTITLGARVIRILTTDKMTWWDETDPPLYVAGIHYHPASGSGNEKTFDTTLRLDVNWQELLAKAYLD